MKGICGVLKISVNLTRNFKYLVLLTPVPLRRTHSVIFFKKVFRKDTANLKSVQKRSF